MIKKDSKGRVLRANEDQVSDGRYRYRFVDALGNRRSIYAWKLTTTDKTPRGKREDLCLREKEEQISRDIADGMSFINDVSTITELLDHYLSTKVSLANATIENYKSMVNKNVRGTSFGSIRIKTVKKSDIKVFYSYLYSKRKFSTSTIQLYQNLLFPAFQLAVDDDLIRKNPCNGCMKDYVQGSMSSTKKPLSKFEQDELLNFIRNNNFYSPYYPMFVFMLGTGCRISETIGMTWKDIDFDKKQVNVDHQVIYRKKDGRCIYYISPPKNRTNRIIPIQDNVISVLKKYKKESYFMSMASTFEVDGYKNFLFPNNAGKLRTPNTIVRTFHGIRDAYNKQELELAEDEHREPHLLPSFTPHTLRHTYCTRMAENGMDVKVLQEIMGHKNIAVTMQVYNHGSLERSKKEIESLNEVINI